MCFSRTQFFLCPRSKADTFRISTHIQVILLILFFSFGNTFAADTGYLPKVDEGGEASLSEVKLYVSGGELFHLKAPAATMFVSDPNIADIQVPAKDRVFIFGKKPGRTTFFALREDGTKSDSFNVKVTYNTTDLTRFLRLETGDLPVAIIETPQGVILKGTVPTAEIAERVRAIAIRLAGEGNSLINNLRVTGSMQVSIRVRIAEVTKSVIKDLGVRWSAAGSVGAFNFGTQGTLGTTSTSPGKNFSITALVDAMAAEGLVSILAEPTLTAMSGEKASFLAGGEFPIPIVQGQNNNSISVDYRKYGVALEFTPTVLSDRLISMHIKPEVSELSTEGAVNISNFQIPAITTRRTETTIQLGSGQSLVIAGLVQNRFSTEIDKLPGIGDLPVLGALFRSTRFRKNETELVIIVTPFIVSPVSDPNDLTLPTASIAPASDIERILEGRLAKKRPEKGALKINGDAGFMIK